MTDALSSTPAITDPAAAAAAGKCYLARVGREMLPEDRQVNEAHPRPCEWCAYPPQVLIDNLIEFNSWAGYDSSKGTYAEPEVKRFATLPRQDQRARSHRAAYGDGVVS